jgi:uncharacterized protein (DUF885 family)
MNFAVNLSRAKARMVAAGIVGLGVGVAGGRANPEFDRRMDALAREWVKAEPLWGSYSQYLPREEQRELDRRFAGPDGTYVEAAAQRARVAQAERTLEAIRSFPESGLTPPQRHAARVVRWYLEDQHAVLRAGGSPYVFDQFWGFQVIGTLMLNQLSPLQDAEDVANFLLRLEAFGPALDAGVAEAESRAGRGMIPPRFIIDSAVNGLDLLLRDAPAKNLLAVTFRQRLEKLDAVPRPERDAAIAAAERTVERTVLPALRRVRAMLLAHRHKATDAAGLRARPGGTELYRALLASSTTTRMSPDDVHALGLREVARIEADMDRELRALGYTQGSLNARVEKLTLDSQPPAEPDPRPMLLAKVEGYVRDAEERATALFDLRPRAKIEVRREPAFTEKTAAASYMPPASDGSRPGIYWLPLPGPKFDVLDLRTTAYHEGVPGHHFQIALQSESDSLPRYLARSAFGNATAFSEGWALYAERIADEAGWYVGDPRGRIGYLAAQLLRARRLVVDTGLHTKGWTRQQAIDFGLPVSEVERYCVLPGQACAYMVGQLRILELRARAKDALGAKFALKEFHAVVLRTGSVPLDVLEQVVAEWIRERRG